MSSLFRSYSDSLFPSTTEDDDGRLGLLRPLLYVRALTLDPFLDMLRCVFKTRPDGLRNLLFLMFANYGCYLFLLSERSLSYNYMLRVFEVCCWIT